MADDFFADLYDWQRRNPSIIAGAGGGSAKRGRHGQSQQSRIAYGARPFAFTIPKHGRQPLSPEFRNSRTQVKGRSKRSGDRSSKELYAAHDRYGDGRELEMWPHPGSEGAVMGWNRITAAGNCATHASPHGRHCQRCARSFLRRCQRGGDALTRRAVVGKQGSFGFSNPSRTQPCDDIQVGAVQFTARQVRSYTRDMPAQPPRRGARWTKELHRRGSALAGLSPDGASVLCTSYEHGSAASLGCNVAPHRGTAHLIRPTTRNATPEQFQTPLSARVIGTDSSWQASNVQATALPTADHRQVEVARPGPSSSKPVIDEIRRNGGNPPRTTN